jgi:hypothetical protein
MDLDRVTIARSFLIWRIFFTQTGAPSGQQAKGMLFRIVLLLPARQHRAISKTFVDTDETSPAHCWTNDVQIPEPHA